MTEQRGDFEHTLGQGLKRWAEHGQASLDLEAFVKGRPARRPGHWKRWTSAAAAAVLLGASLTATFPRWAGAAAGWPIVGPVVTEIIMKDAGLKWAYDQGLIQGTVAEAKDGDVSVRILGFVADQTRTTLIYQITGWKEPAPASDKPQPAEADRGNWILPRRMHRPVNHPPRVAIARINGEGMGSWGGQNLLTPVGLVGTVTTWPMEQQSAPVEVVVQFGERKLTLDFTIHRSDKDSHSVAADPTLSQTIKGVTVTVNSVSYTPAETLVRYTISGRMFTGSVQFDGEEGTPRIENGGREVKATGSNGRYTAADHLEHFDTFPAVSGPTRLIIPTLVTGADVDLVWPLKEGATQETAGAVITLDNWHQTGNQVGFGWHYPRNGLLMGLSELEVLDSAGKSYPVQVLASSTSIHQGEERRTEEGTIPDGVTAVAVRVKQVGLRVDGPWTFVLPK